MLFLLSMETRARRAVCERASALPSEVWQLILSFLSPAEAIRAALVCSDFASISSPAAQQACGRLWPQHAHRIARIGAQRFLRLIQAHEGELAAHPEVTKAKSIQKTVCSGHRQIAVEWLIEVRLYVDIEAGWAPTGARPSSLRLEFRSSRSSAVDGQLMPVVALAPCNRVPDMFRVPFEASSSTHHRSAAR